MTKRLSLLGFFLFGMLVCGVASPGAALAAVTAIPQEDSLDDCLEVADVGADAGALSDSAMDTARAGFSDPTGLIYKFAVDVKTSIDGSVTFTRSIVMTADATGQLAATSNATLQTQNLASGVSASVVDSGKGVVVTDSKGTTTALNQTASGALASVVLNTASDRLVTQTLDISIVLQGVRAVTAQTTSALSSVNGLMQGINLHSVGLGH